MSTPDPRLDEIQARLDAAEKGPWFLDADGVSIYYVFHNGDTLDRDRLAESSGDDAILIANAPADLAYLLAELRKAHEALERVEALHKRVEGYQFGAITGAEPDWPVCSTCFTDDEHPQPWPCPTAAAVAAAKGDEQ